MFPLRHLSLDLFPSVNLSDMSFKLEEFETNVLFSFYPKAVQKYFFRNKYKF